MADNNIATNTAAVKVRVRRDLKFKAILKQKSLRLSRRDKFYSVIFTAS